MRVKGPSFKKALMADEKFLQLEKAKIFLFELFEELLMQMFLILLLGSLTINLAVVKRESPAVVVGVLAFALSSKFHNLCE